MIRFGIVGDDNTRDGWNMWRKIRRSFSSLKIRKVDWETVVPLQRHPCLFSEAVFGHIRILCGRCVRKQGRRERWKQCRRLSLWAVA